MLSVSMIVCGVLLAASPEASTAKAADFAFLCGHWATERGGTATEEHWTEPRAGTVFGVGRTIKGEKTVFFEFLRIEERAGAVYYVAQPGGKPPTPFKLTSFDGTKAVFENPEHDYPKKIIYEKVGDDVLKASTHGPRNGQDSVDAWEYHRVK